ncbi:taurine catabolism dioxygenase TauD [Pholiota conissans]|uniref:Taurine catabolism dioxygenase TauD n=1 Tax=Pholiota conissans TaxID=109636 RepID=A0A9P5YZS5_9AGAR|nr:taurine catabolism dioxygenase TauD [Pholiota conissans]
MAAVIDSTVADKNADSRSPARGRSWSWKQPDITYHPDRRNWEERTARRLAENPSLPHSMLPEGFPTKLTSPLVWEGKDWKGEEQWVFNLTPAHLEEIDAAVKHFHGLGAHFGHISPKSFPLPTLGPALRDLSRELHSGRGFFVLRTIPVDSYSKEDNVLIYAGVSSHVGETRGLQDKNGGVLSHIKDLSHLYPKGAIGGPAYTTEKQVFHTDQGTDIVSLFALQIAAEGGVSRISSSWRVYNDLAENRPDLIQVLAQPWIVDEFGRDPPFTERPLLYYIDSKIVIQYARRYFTGFQGLPRSANIAPITEAQAEALDALHFLAEKYSLGLNFQKGDIQYINNLSIFHARDGFRDSHTKTRHLLRLYQRNEELAWKLPEPLKLLWARTYDVVPENQTFAIEPVIRDAVRGKN